MLINLMEIFTHRGGITKCRKSKFQIPRSDKTMVERVLPKKQLSLGCSPLITTLHCIDK